MSFDCRRQDEFRKPSNGVFRYPPTIERKASTMSGNCHGIAGPLSHLGMPKGRRRPGRSAGMCIARSEARRCHTGDPESGCPPGLRPRIPDDQILAEESGGDERQAGERATGDEKRPEGTGNSLRNPPMRNMLCSSSRR
jgi:hypothetical protein